MGVPITQRRIEVFFYGLFMDAELLHSKGAHPENVRMAAVPGFELRIGQRATLLPKSSACAWGILMQLTHAEIEQLYSEPSVQPTDPKLCSCRSATALSFRLSVSTL